MNNKKYLIFGSKFDHPMGGIQDLIKKDIVSLKEAIDTANLLVNNKSFLWVEVVDHSSMNRIYMKTRNMEKITSSEEFAI